MYMPYQMLIAIENDRLRSLQRHHLRQEVAREGAARRRGGRQRTITRVLWPRAAAGAAR